MTNDFQYLNQPTFRQKFEAQNNFFVAEGLKVINRALELGYQPRSLLGTAEWISQLAEVSNQFEVHELSKDEIAKVAGYQVHRGLLATFHRKGVHTPVDLLKLNRPLVLLENLVDLENLGSIFRTCAALDIAGVLLTTESPDPYYRRCIKASMGATLQIPFAFLPTGFELTRPILGFSPKGEILISNLVPNGNEILAFGSEGNGLSESLLAKCETKVSIPMANSVDSLNVAASAAIGIWEYLQRVK